MDKAKISDAEWLVMEVVWTKSPITGAEIVDVIDKKDWSPRTVKSLIARLVKKGVLSFEADGKTYLYSAMLSRDDCIRTESRTFLNRMFRGSLQPMLAYFIDNEMLSDKEIADLKKLLDEKTGDD